MVALHGSSSLLSLVAAAPPAQAASRPIVALLRFYSVLLGVTGALLLVLVTDLRLLAVVVGILALTTWSAYRVLRRQGPLPASPKVVIVALVVTVVGLAVGIRADAFRPLWIIPVVLAPVALGCFVSSVRRASADIDRALAELILLDSAAPDRGHEAL